MSFDTFRALGVIYLLAQREYRYLETSSNLLVESNGTFSPNGERCSVLSFLCLPVNCRFNYFSGDLLYLNVAGQRIVVLNSQKTANELLNRRAGKSSDRPRNIVAAEILTCDLFFALSRYNDVYVVVLLC